MARMARQRRGTAALAIALAALALLLAPVANGAAGDVYVVDEEFGTRIAQVFPSVSLGKVREVVVLR